MKERGRKDAPKCEEEGFYNERKRESERRKKRDIEAMGRGYIIPALRPSAFAFENKMRKYGPRLVLPLPHRSVDKDSGEHGEEK